MTLEDFERLIAELSNLPTSGINIDWERLTIIEQRLAALEAKIDALYNATTLQQRKGQNDT